jgi:hypothetical protein
MMKKTIAIGLLGLVSLCSSCGSESGESGKRDIVTLPGTGVSVSLPQGILPGPLGTYFTDASGETILQFTAGPAAFNFENKALYKAVFPDPPERLKTAHLTGNLYKRVRVLHGGKWDGWWLSVVRGGSALTVQAMYTGKDAAQFERLKTIFSDLSWDETRLNTELAFGAHIPLQNLHLVSGVFGGLSYTESGQAGDRGASLIVETNPVPPSRGKTLLPAVCAPGIAAAMQKAAYSGPHFLNENGIVACDGWSTETHGPPTYVMFLLMPNGAVLTAIGSGTPEQFRSALLGMQLTRAGQTDSSNHVLSEPRPPPNH